VLALDPRLWRLGGRALLVEQMPELLVEALLASANPTLMTIIQVAAARVNKRPCGGLDSPVLPGLPRWDVGQNAAITPT
jgi:hypothetical protein